MGNNPNKAEKAYLDTGSVKAYMEAAEDEFLYKWEHPTQNNAKFDDFKRIRTLGAGAFGVVFLVLYRQNKGYYAMKMLDKTKIKKMQQIEHTLNEKRVLQAINFPFLVKLDFTFKDNSNVYIVLEFISGGEMFAYLRKVNRFTEPQAKLYAAQVVLGFEYLHGLHVLYRDLKPENIILDHRGYIKITDMGFAKRVQTRTYTMCGTPEYIAPEIIQNKGYATSVDWWTVGILIFEMASGYPPFQGDQHMTIYERIIEGKYKFPKHFSSNIKDLCRNLIQHDRTRRFGNLKGGVNDVKNHPWFREVNWVQVYQRKIHPPYIPVVKDPGDPSKIDKSKEVKVRISAQNKFAQDFKDF